MTLASDHVLLKCTPGLVDGFSNIKAMFTFQFLQFFPAYYLLSSNANPAKKIFLAKILKGQEMAIS